MQINVPEHTIHNALHFLEGFITFPALPIQLQIKENGCLHLLIYIHIIVLVNRFFVL